MIDLWKERASFETWCKTHCGLCDRDLHQTVGGAYRSGYVDDMWDGWQARAALVVPTQGADARPVAKAWKTTNRAVCIPFTEDEQVAKIWREHGYEVIEFYATRDAEPSDRPLFSTRQDAARYRWITENSDNANTLHSILLCHEGDDAKIRERIDYYRHAPREKT